MFRKYHIKAVEVPNPSIMDEDGKGRDSYLGCTMENRSPYPGETHLRGNDLPDGKFNEETWKKILIAIISNELQSIFNPQPLKTVTIEEI